MSLSSSSGDGGNDDLEEPFEDPNKPLYYYYYSELPTNNHHGNYTRTHQSNNTTTTTNNNNITNKDLEEFSNITTTTTDHEFHDDYPIIDAVITWVNASQPLFFDELRQHSKEAGMSIHANRYRDNGELRYTMRSINTYAPWIRQIFLVISSKETNQIPYWLDVHHPKIKIVEHHEIWEDPALLPVYTSSSIEPHLYRIEGLSQDFLYFNDDIMLTKPLLPYQDLWFSQDKRERIIYQGKSSYKADPTEESGYNKALAQTHQLYVKKYGERRHIRKKKFAHVPYFFNKQIWKEIRSVYFKEEYDEFLLNATIPKRRFRSSQSMWLQTHTMYHHFLMWNLQNATTYPYLYTEVTNSDSRKSLYSASINLRNNYTLNKQRFQDFEAHKSKFLNMQDHFHKDDTKKSKGKVSREVRDQIKDFFEKQFPITAPWELD